MPKRIEYKSGEKVGTCFFIEDAISSSSKRRAKVRCGNCDKEFIAILESLRRGITTSCGCLHLPSTIGLRTTTHGMSKTKEYKIYRDIWKRCFNPNVSCSKNYLLRGITMCNGWKNSFESFFADMGERPSIDYSVDRINNDKNYSCGHCDHCIANGWDSNCRWATDSEQARNRRDALKVHYNGESKPLADFCEEKGVRYKNVWKRIKNGWSVKDAFETPIGQKPKTSNFISHSFGVVAV